MRGKVMGRIPAYLRRGSLTILKEMEGGVGDRGLSAWHRTSANMLAGEPETEAAVNFARHLLLLPRTGLEAQGVEGDEAGGVVLVVGLFLAAFHGGDGFGIHAVRRAAAGLHDVAFI